MTDWIVTVCLALLAGALAWAEPLDQTKLVAEYKAADLAYKDGKGLSESADSGSLGWGEAAYLRNYSRMWLVTRDPYWLGKIEDHFTRIVGHATDPDGDGFLGWQTATYSGAVYWCLPLHNRGTATIEPEFFKEIGKSAKDVTGQIFAVRMNEIFLMGQSRPLRSIHRSEGWTPQSIAEHGMPALKSSFYKLDRSADIFPWDPV